VVEAIIEATTLEFGLYRDEHDQLDADLRAAGIRVSRPPHTEERGLPGQVTTAYETVKIVLDYAGFWLTVEEIVRRCLRRAAASGNHRTVRIYDSRGRRSEHYRDRRRRRRLAIRRRARCSRRVAPSRWGVSTVLSTEEAK
jgi:hypothetical protein